ncbi:proteinase inhibitor [Myroides sp. BIT-d1]|uniref:Proteinase inhibitor n=1 Tax=Myroides albus TaxID=2562892 RepID=A0A6I3LK09_9FLAO|nr:ecotin family protein [Myroides albus]MTG98623.1 proteinase inhibitor [Myroides albus]
MKKILSILMLFAITTTGVMAQTVNRLDPSIFPSPEKGYKQVLIEVPFSKNDNDKKIEFSVGKVMEVDGCNNFGLVGTLKEKNLEGWGYTYYSFESKGDVFSTMMGCPDAAKRNIFVSGKSELVRYNGRLPIVVYIPEDMEVRFKVYKTDGEEYFANEVKTKK